jgi:hypothetical protein
MLPSSRERIPRAICCIPAQIPAVSVTYPISTSTTAVRPCGPPWAIAARYTTDRAPALNKAHFQFQHEDAHADQGKQLIDFMFTV